MFVALVSITAKSGLVYFEFFHRRLDLSLTTEKKASERLSGEMLGCFPA